ncbi:MAG: response regulator transcription factor [candidate division Zixibacteria bacterium]|nr:response regulator transcription factor [candidate division Zixibacteria bacterium]
MSEIKILLLEDDRNLGMLIKEHLEMQGYRTTLRVNGEDGFSAYRNDHFDLCLVDVMMPKKDGFTFAREIRQENQEIPLIFLTAKSLKEDKIQGFNIGCDDYLTKPFSMEELLLRIRAVLKRSIGSQKKESAVTEFEIGSYFFDCRKQTLENKKNKYKLTPKETDLLRLLCLNINQTLKRDTALNEIWGNNSYFSGRSMDVFVSKLRKYLHDDRKIEIMSIHGKGIRLIVN